MQPRFPKKVKNSRHFPLILILLAGLALGTFAVAAGQQQTGQAQPVIPETPPAAQSAPGATGQPVEAAVPNLEITTVPSSPPEYVPLVQKTTSALLAPDFTFYPVKALNPFVPFISPATTAARLADEEEPRLENEKPLTPLQKMTLAEIEKGLKAITWGALGRKAVIEDSTGKGYIVAVGTPAGERSGVITQIFNDRLVIQQEIWDRKAKKRYPQDFVLKLVKKTDGK